MRHNLVFTGSGPIIVIHTYSGISDPALLEKLSAKGILKFIAFELDGEELKKTYGGRYQQIAADVAEKNDMRVLDYDGHRILGHFDFAQLQAQTPFFRS